MSGPGRGTASLASRLREREQRNVTFLADDFPIFWDSASGAVVTDVDGNEYVDCTAAFGVANAGHCNERVVAALAKQAGRLVHGMGDVHPTQIRVELYERLAAVLPPALSATFLSSTGSEAVEAALKTAMLRTGKPRFATYRGAYHGLSFGALSVGGIERFRQPFAPALGRPPLLLEYPRAGGELTAAQAAEKTEDALANARDVGALIIEPVQGRAGCIAPPAGYLAALRAVCDDCNVVMIVDEIFTGFGRTGAWFAIECENVVPDILCIGKALGSGVPIAATVGRQAIMDAWPPSTGEALHTSTYLGNPLACAAAIATIDEIARLDLPSRALRLGEAFAQPFQALARRRDVVEVRRAGFFWGVQLSDAAVAARVVRTALREGVIFLQSGIEGDTVAVSPPLVIEEALLARAVEVLDFALERAQR